MMADQTPTPTDWHRYVDDKGRCAICGMTSGRLTGYRRDRDGNMRLPSKVQWHRRATEAEQKKGLSCLVRSASHRGAGKNVRQIRGKLVLHEAPLHILQAIAFAAAGETERRAARLAGIKPKSLSRYKARHPALFAMIEQQAACIVEAMGRREEQRLEAKADGPPRLIEYEDGPLADTVGQGSTLADFLHKVYRPLRLLNCSDWTLVQYGVAIRTLDRYAGRPVCLSDLSDELVAGCMGWLLANGRAPATANKFMRHATTLWRFAAKKRLVTTTPDVDPVREPKRAPEAWSVDEMTKILDAASEAPGFIDGTPACKFWPAILLTLYDTGLRVGAALGLDRDSLDANSGWLHVPAAVQKQNADQRFLLHVDTLAAIAALQETAAGRKLFPWPYRREALYQHMGAIVRRAGLPDGRRNLFHRIRRTTATAVADKLGRAAAQDYLGHSCLSVTLRYLDPSKINGVHAVDVLPRPVKGGVA